VKNPQGAYRLLLPALAVAFILISVAEVWLLTLVGSWIGVGWTLLILVAEAFVGAWLLRREGRKSWSALARAYEDGRTPTGHLADAALVLAGGIMLILPGFFTDIIGLIFLLPFTRPLARKGLGWLVAWQVSRAGLNLGSAQTKYAPGVVPGEVVDEPKSSRPSPADPDVISGEIE
jgi:UPF0716 protein FxsA